MNDQKLHKQNFWPKVRLFLYVASFLLGIVFGYWQAVAYVTVLSVIALLEGAWTDKVTVKSIELLRQDLLEEIRKNNPERTG